MKYSSPWHAEKCCILLILSEQGRYFFHDGSELSGGVPCWGGISFMEARWKWRWCPWSVSTGPRCPWAAAGHYWDTCGNERAAGVGAAGGTGGPGCGARGRWRRLTDNTLTTSTARLEATRRPEIWRGIATPEIWRAAAHGRIKQPGPTKHMRRPETATQHSN